MSGHREISEAIQALAGTQFATPCFMFDAEVTSVDEDARTCNIKTIGGDTEIEIEDVRLMAEVDDGVLLIPADGSRIIVTYNKNIIPFVSQFSEIKKIVWTIGDSSLDVTDDKKFVFNKGDNYGLVKVKELKEQLNVIEDSINDLKAVFSGWTPVPNDGGAALKAAAGSWFGVTIAPTQQSDIENTDIKH